MIDESFVAAYTSPDIFQRGKRMYEDGKVSWLESREDEITGLIQIEAGVESTHGNDEFDVNITLSRGGKWIVDFSCDCPYYESYARPCKHIVAVLLAYINQETNAVIGNGRRKRKPSRHTDSSLKALLDQFSAPALISAPMLPVELTPVFTDCSGGVLSVEFRIHAGAGHRYILKNITEFVKNIEGNSKFRYGKDLEFIHNEQAFTPSSLPIVQFLENIINEKDSYKPQNNSYTSYYSYSYYYEPPVKRNLNLRGRYLDDFFALCQDQPIYSLDNIPFFLSDEQPDIKASLRQTDEGYEITADPFRILDGNEYTYLLPQTENTFYRQKYSKPQTIDMLRWLSQLPKEGAYIAPDDLPAFARYLFPLLTRTTRIENNQFDPEEYVPPRPDFEIRLDYPQEDEITCELWAVYPDQKYNVFAGIDTSGNRDVESEQEMDNFVSPWFNSFDELHARMVIINDEDKMYDFLKNGIPALQEKAVVYISDALKKLQIRPMSKVTIGISVSHDLLQLDFVSETMKPEQLAEILSKYERKKKYYRLKNGEFIDVDASLDELAELSDSLDLKKKDIAKGTVDLPTYMANYLDIMEEEDNRLNLQADKSFRDMVHKMKDSSRLKVDIPEGLNATLRPYQKAGFEWLWALKQNGFAGLLADEMGLGKTLQVITFIGAWKDRKRSLVVCPASLVYNWASEFHKFMPSLSVRMIAGPADIRKELIHTSEDQDILITSYDLLKRDTEFYQDMEFSVEVIDEAQYIKNANTQAAKGVKLINASFRIALTGTPIENKLSELWSIFDYMMPRFFHGYEYFKKMYETPIIKEENKDVEARLRKMITPFVLRRLKKDVLKDLPDKLEEVYYAPLEGEQKEQYEARVQRLKLLLTKQSDQEFKENKMVVLAELTRLRQICCDPSLLYNNYRGNSAKADMCIDMIANAVESGHKILLFSQFTTMLDVLAEKLDARGIKFHMLTGATPKKQRAEMVEAFQSDDVPVFCISLKAGGTGLNLTAADIVIHYDPWWNTAVENQASDRAHRIGQKNVVSVYRLIMKDTVEERILSLQQEKSDLAGRILSGEGISSARLTREDLLSLL